MSSDGWVERRVLVTGATGVIGSRLVRELLSAGAEVVALVFDADPDSELVRSGDLERITVVNGALEDLGSIEGALAVHGPDTVFHLGAQTLVEVARDEPLRTWEANVRGTYNLLEACRRHLDAVERIVVASSDKAYGETASLPYTETTPLEPRNPYEVSKACADLIARSYYHAYGLPVAIARCGNVYGPGDLNWSRIVPGTIRSLLHGERPVVRSDGKYVRDYVFVADVARAYMDLGTALGDERVRGEAFNFSDESPLTVLDVVTLISRLMAREDLQPVVLDAAVGEIRDQILTARKARDVLGWQPRWAIEDGLRETIDWYRGILA